MNDLRVKSSARTLALSAAVFYLLVIALLFLKVRANNEGHFTYALDDPYIHLGLSEQLAHGHYGLNPHEASSPSSSIAWPFLLIPFAGHTGQVYLPLFWNILFGLISVCVIAATVARLPAYDMQERTDWIRKLATVLLLMMVGNLVSLTLVGMEHVLQVCVAIVCAAGLVYAWDEGRVPVWCMLAAAAGPMVRYENISLTVAVCVALFALRQWAKAAVILLAGVMSIMLFGVFLRSNGLPMLPMSVLVKGSAYQNNGNVLTTAIQMLVTNARAVINNSNYWPILLVGVFLACALYREQDRLRRAILAGGILVVLAQVGVGRFGWFHRYEVYALIFATLILIRAVKVPSSLSFSYFVLGLFYLASQYVEATTMTMTAAREVYEQQYQMHRFVTNFYHGDVAVNDLGLVSYQRPAGTYVLDVFGLASPEASRQQHKTAAWLEEITRRHGVNLAILYPDWYKIPQSWTPMGRMCNSDQVKVIAKRCVVFYSTTAGSNAEIRTGLARFATTLPKGVTFQLAPPESENGVLPQQVSGEAIGRANDSSSGNAR